MKIYQLTPKLMLLFCLLGGLSLKAQISDSREIGKNFRMGAEDKLLFDGKHAEVYIHSWDKDEMKMTARLEVSGKRADDVRALLEAMDVTATQSGSTIQVEAALGPFKNMNSNDRGSEFLLKNGTKVRDIQKHKMTVDIYLPRTAELIAEHKFGSLALTDGHTGPVRLDMRHGSLTTQDLRGEADIDIAHGSATFSSLRNANLDLHHSSGTLGQVSSLNIDLQHGSIKIGDADEVNGDANHSSLAIGSVGIFDLDNNYSSVEVGSLSRASNMDINYGSLHIKEVKKGFSQIRVDANMSNVQIEPASGLDYEVELENEHGEIRVDRALQVEQDQKESQSHYLKGYMGSRGGKIKVEMRHGKIVVE